MREPTENATPFVVHPVAPEQWEIVAWLWQCFRHDLALIVSGLPYADGRYQTQGLRTERRTRVVEALVALANAIITIRRLLRRTWTSHRWTTRPPADHDLSARPLSWPSSAAGRA